jgi:hypothetical protein
MQFLGPLSPSIRSATSWDRGNGVTHYPAEEPVRYGHAGQSQAFGGESQSTSRKIAVIPHSPANFRLDS